MLIAFNRRTPRTKSVFDRTSSRRYSSLDYDSNGSYDNHQEHNEDIYQNGFDSVLRQNDDAILSLNGHDIDGDDDNSDEYACFIFMKCYFFSFLCTMVFFAFICFYY
jgi:hypothetical protein